jgi:hypothetical protein
MNWMGWGSSIPPNRSRLTRGNERSIINAIYNRIAIDVSSVDIKHVKMDSNGRFTEVIAGPLNDILNRDANIDQTGRAFILDAVTSMFDEGVVALVPVDTDVDPVNGAFKVLTARTGKIVQWFPYQVLVQVYNERTGKQEQVLVPKEITPIIPNPFYSVMNEPNSMLQRLIRKLNLLDAIDEQSGSGKLDLIIQLPYTVKSPAKQELANKRKQEIEMQLTGSKYGIAYIDSTEKVTQLNRAVDNNLLKQIEYLTSMVYNQLGLTEEIFNGTADEKTMLNYNNRAVEPILNAFVEEIRRKWLTKTARSQGQSVMFFRDPFRLVPVSSIADIADKFTRNEILSSNEIRGIIGYRPAEDPRADELRNKNLNQSADAEAPVSVSEQDLESS